LGEKFFYSIFFSRQNGLQGTTKMISEGIFAVVILFTLFRELKIGGEKFSFDFSHNCNVRRSPKTIPEGVLAVETFLSPFSGG